MSRINQMQEISSFVKCIVIQGGVGREEKTIFNLSNLSSLTTLQMGRYSFKSCCLTVFESDNDE